MINYVRIRKFNRVYIGICNLIELNLNSNNTTQDNDTKEKEKKDLAAEQFFDIMIKLHIISNSKVKIIKHLNTFKFMSLKLSQQ